MAALPAERPASDSAAFLPNFAAPEPTLALIAEEKPKPSPPVSRVKKFEFCYASVQVVLIAPWITEFYALLSMIA